MKNVKKRIEYLKNVAREEISAEIKRIKESGVDICESAEYDQKKEEQSLIEMEIMRLEKGKIEHLEQRKENIKWCDLRKDIWLKYINNDYFLDISADRKFTDEEKVALIVNNRNQSLETKIKDLCTIIDNNKDVDLRQKISLWIDCKRKTLKYIYQLNSNDIVFLLVYPSHCVNQKLYKTYNQALENTNSISRISIEKIFNEKEANRRGSIGNIFLTENKQVVDVSIFGFEHPYFELPKGKRLQDIKVKFDNPFMAYQYLKVPFRCGNFIVADSKNKTVKEFLSKTDNEISNFSGWLDIDCAIYTFPNCWELECGLELKRLSDLPFCLNDIQVIKKDSITIGQSNYIDEIKKRADDNKNSI